MPPDLVKAHQTLDKAVDLCYRPLKFARCVPSGKFFGTVAQVKMGGCGHWMGELNIVAGTDIIENKL